MITKQTQRTRKIMASKLSVLLLVVPVLLLSSIAFRQVDHLTPADATRAPNANYRIESDAFNQAGGSGSSSLYQLQDNLGESVDSGASASANYMLCSGFLCAWTGHYVVYVPTLRRLWPPIPDAPVLDTVDNITGANNYTVTWSASSLAIYYILQEATDSSFANAANLYPGLATSYPVTGKGPTRYYYRVMAHSQWADSDWSNIQHVDVLWELEPNNSYLQANGPLVMGLFYNGYPDDQRDFYKVYLPSAGEIDVDLTNDIGNGVQLQLFYQDTTHLVSYQTSPPYHLEYTGSAGWYYIYIFNETGFSTTSPYTLQVTTP